MSEIMDLTVIEIKPEQAPTLYRAGGLVVVKFKWTL